MKESPVNLSYQVCDQLKNNGICFKPDEIHLSSSDKNTYQGTENSELTLTFVTWTILVCIQ